MMESLPKLNNLPPCPKASQDNRHGYKRLPGLWYDNHWNGHCPIQVWSTLWTRVKWLILPKSKWVISHFTHIYSTEKKGSLPSGLESQIDSAHIAMVTLKGPGNCLDYRRILSFLINTWLLDYNLFFPKFLTTLAAKANVTWQLENRPSSLP